MILTSIGKRFVYVSILMMLASMLLPWDSLEDYTYSESMGLLMNIIPAIIFVCAAAIVVLKPLGMILSRIGTNVVFLILCLMNGIVLYIGMQYYPDSYLLVISYFPHQLLFLCLELSSAQDVLMVPKIAKYRLFFF